MRADTSVIPMLWPVLLHYLGLNYSYISSLTHQNIWHEPQRKAIVSINCWSYLLSEGMSLWGRIRKWSSCPHKSTGLHLESNLHPKSVVVSTASWHTGVGSLHVSAAISTCWFLWVIFFLVLLNLSALFCLFVKSDVSLPCCGRHWKDLDREANNALYFTHLPGV